MSRCTCNNPCTCYFEYDGDRPNTSYTSPYQYGRDNTKRRGSGTPADPYIIEFLDSEEFQVEAGQIRVLTDQVLTTATSAPITNFAQTDYETPNEIFLATDIHLTDGNLYPSAHRFWFITAETTFVSNGVVNGSRRLYIQWHPPADFYGTLVEILVTGVTSTGLPGAEDITLNCSGLLPFAQVQETPWFYGPGGSLRIVANQSSGSNMTIRNSRVSIIAI